MSTFAHKCLPLELLYEIVPFIPAKSAVPNALSSCRLLHKLLLPRVIKWKERMSIEQAFSELKQSTERALNEFSEEFNEFKQSTERALNEFREEFNEFKRSTEQTLQLILQRFDEQQPETRKDEGTSPHSQSSLDLASHMEAASQSIQLLQSKLEQGTSGAAVQPRSVPSAAGGSYVRKMVKAFDNEDKEPDIWLDPTHHSIIVYWKAVERAATYSVYKVVDRRLVLVREVTHMGDVVVHDCNCGGLKASMSHTFTVIAFGPNGEVLKRFDNVTGRYFPELG